MPSDEINVIVSSAVAPDRPEKVIEPLAATGPFDRSPN